MRIWTLQKRSVMDTIQRRGGYIPDFSLSTYPFLRPGLENLYGLLLNSFNSYNQTSYPGLIFGMLSSDNRSLYEVLGIEGFLQFLRPRLNAVESLWKNLSKDALLLEVDFPENLNCVAIDINDFQTLMPPVILAPPYTQELFNTICGNLRDGLFAPSPFPSGIAQVHIPYIAREHIVGAWEAPSLDDLRRVSGQEGFAVSLDPAGWQSCAALWQYARWSRDSIQSALHEISTGRRIDFIYKENTMVRGDVSISLGDGQHAVIDRFCIDPDARTGSSGAMREMLESAIMYLTFQHYSELCVNFQPERGNQGQQAFARFLMDMDFAPVMLHENDYANPYRRTVFIRKL